MNKQAIIRAEIKNLGADLVSEMSAPELHDLLRAKYNVRCDLREIRRERKKALDSAGKKLRLPKAGLHP